MAANSIKLTKLQREYFTQLASERNRIERDFQIAAGVALAGGNVDAVLGTTFNFDGETLQYALPDEAPAK
jgi:hypothetical protein